MRNYIFKKKIIRKVIRLYTEIVVRLLAQKLNPVGAQRLMRVIKSCTKLSVACSSVHSHVSLCSFHLLFNQRARRGTRTMTSIQYGNARHNIQVLVILPGRQMLDFNHKNQLP